MQFGEWMRAWHGFSRPGQHYDRHSFRHGVGTALRDLISDKLTVRECYATAEPTSATALSPAWIPSSSKPRTN